MSDVFEVVYPFVLCTRQVFDAGGIYDVVSWRPGVDFRPASPEDYEACANGFGKMILTVVSRHKPGRYPERVFYTREWVSPAGNGFGKPKLHIATAQKFTRLCRGYAHSYVVDPGHVPDDVARIRGQTP